MSMTADVATDEALHLSANFALGLFPECLHFLTELTGLPLIVKASLHEQAIQHLSSIADRGTRAASRDVVIVQLSRWCGDARDHAAAQNEKLTGMTDLFLQTLEVAAGTGKSILIAIAPEDAAVKTRTRSALEACRGRILAAIGRRPTVRGLDLQEAIDAYELRDIAQPYHGVDSLPYSEEAQAVMAAWICRHLNLSAGQRCKAVVVDCDNTIWRGECADRQPVVLDASCLRLQRALAECVQRGMLVCLCSKNEADDVEYALTQTRGMVLGASQVALIDTGWGPKSERLRRIASRLELSQDTLLFIDDDSYECADVRFHCPEIAVIKAPGDDDDMRRMLTHLWLLDPAASMTSEDLERTAWYQAQSQRHAHNTGNLEQFLTNIGLTIDIRPLGDDDLPRIVQLSQRARQWNNGAQGWTLDELQAQAASSASFVVQVSDRFSDYGIVGFALARRCDGVLQVPLLLLSCRALGKNVEYSLLHRLALVASEQQCALIEVPVQKTSRNQVLRTALAVVGFGSAKVASGQDLTFQCEPLQLLACLEPRPFGFAVVSGEPFAVSAPRPQRDGGAAEEVQTRAQARAQGLAHLATHFNRAERLLSAIMAHRDHADLESNSTLRAPRTPTEAEVLSIWQSVLGIRELGLDEDFFDLQADSLSAVQILTRVKKNFGVELPLRVLFEKDFTIATIAEAIDLATIAAADDSLVAAELAKLDPLTDTEVASTLASSSRSGAPGVM